MTRFALFLLTFVALPSGFIGYRLGTLRVKPPEIILYGNRGPFVPIWWVDQGGVRHVAQYTCSIEPKIVMSLPAVSR